MMATHKLVATLLLSLLSLVYAYKRRDEAIPMGDLIALEVGQSGRFPSGVTVRMDSISDSRCPIGISCFAAGSASARVQVQKGADNHSYRLWLGPRNQFSNGLVFTDSVAVNLEVQLYKVILRDITPYPDFIHPQQPPKQAVVQVTKL